MPETISALVEDNKSQKYPKNTAGSLVTKFIPTVDPEYTVKKTLNKINKSAKKYATFDYVYVVSEDSLEGIVSMKNLFRKKPDTKVSSFMQKNILTARPYTPMEKVAYMALEKNIKAMPIVDKNGKFIGVVTNDALLNTLYREINEDLFKFAGMSGHPSVGDNILAISTKSALKHRLPWIMAGLGGGLITAQIISGFSGLLQENIVLAAFIPLIAYMANAVGQQISAFVIRDTAFGEVEFNVYLLKHISIVSLIAVIMGALLSLITFLIHRSVRISGVLGISMATAIMTSIITGFFVPYTFSKLKADPANASGPIATVIQDFLSVLVYLVIASTLL